MVQEYSAITKEKEAIHVFRTDHGREPFHGLGMRLCPKHAKISIAVHHALDDR